MRGLHRALISLAMLCFLIVPSLVSSTEWVSYAKSQYGFHYYDKEGITSTPDKQIKRAWGKIIYSEMGRHSFIINRRNNGFALPLNIENLSHSIDQHGFNCSTREWFLFSSTDYDLNDKILESIDYEKIRGEYIKHGLDLPSYAKWQSIEPNSGSETLFNVVCNKQKKK